MSLKNISFSLCLSLAINTSVGQLDIQGPTQVNLNQTFTYFAYGGSGLSMLDWWVSGGTILDSGPGWVMILWNGSQTTGYVEAYDPIYSYSGWLAVQISGIWEPGIISTSTTNLGYNQSVIFTGYSPNGGDCYFNYQYQWESSSNGINFTEIPGAIQSDYSFQTPPASQTIYIRRRVTCGSIVDYSNTIQLNVSLIPLNGGSLTTTAYWLTYNAIPSVNQSAAFGSNCQVSNYVYTWEYSIDGGFWTPLSGSSITFPSSSMPGVTDYTLIRRKVSCGSEIAYSNIVQFDVSPSANSENISYFRESIINKKGIKSSAVANNLPIGDKYQLTKYTDGLQREIQTVNKQSSADGFDVVTPLEFDKFGRANKAFLPYVSTSNDGKFKSNYGAEVNSFLQSAYSDNGPFYQLTEFENSPLSRVKKQFQAGSSWVGNPTPVGREFKLEMNEQSLDDVRIWEIDNSESSLPYSNNRYTDGQLYKNVEIDERGFKTITYKDKEGRVVLSKTQNSSTPSNSHLGWVCTYFVYDDFGRQRFVLSPGAVKILNNTYTPAAVWTVSQLLADELCFKTVYDNKGRNIVKKNPGVQGEVSMVYDSKDRLVFSQTPKQKVTNEWFFTLYDPTGRAIVTGLYYSALSRQALQDIVDQLSITTQSLNISTKDINNAIVSEVVKVDYPAFDLNSCSACKVNTVSYFDGYNYPGAKSFTTSSSQYQYGYASGVQEAEIPINDVNTNGFVTGIKVRLLDNTDRFLMTTNFYDSRGRAVQIHSDNASGYTDINTKQYSFSGKVLSTYIYHKKHNTSGVAEIDQMVMTRNEYDNYNRLLRVYKKIGNSPEKLIVENAYNKMGQRISKRVGPGSPADELSTYDYSLQGWLRGMNKSYSSNPVSTSNKFGFEICYDQPNNYSFTPLYNGHISGIAWKSFGDNVQRKYAYNYDFLNRVTTVDFSQKNSLSATNWTNDKADFGCAISQYDDNGNIKQLIHKGIIPGLTPKIIDNIQYTYGFSNQNNLLLKTSDSPDGGFENGKTGDFKDGTNPGDDYDYDESGNLKFDKNKGIASISYNFLNKPELITYDGGKGSIKFTYDALGNKLSKFIVDNSVPGNSRQINIEYISGFIYQDNKLLYFPHEGGRVRIKIINPNLGYQSSNLAYIFDYYLKDHLGNVRMVLTEEQETEQIFATMELTPTSTFNIEDAYFGQVAQLNNVRENMNTLPPQFQANNPNNYSVIRLNNSQVSRKMGPYKALKVMAGDALALTVKYYYQYTVSGSNPSTDANQILNSLAAFFFPTSSSSTVPGAKFSNTAYNSSLINGLAGAFLNNSSNRPNYLNSSDGTPKAYLNYLLFDEQFNFVSGGIRQVGPYSTNPQFRMLGTDFGIAGDVAIQKNGYAIVYLSNESDVDVIFDQLEIQHKRGPLLEETHYYPFGLSMAGISSQAAARPQVTNRYNGKEFHSKEFNDGSGLEWYDYGMREYDPQIARFFRHDPISSDFPSLSPYQYASNNPIKNIDLDGLEGYTIDYGINELWKSAGFYSIGGKTHFNPDSDLGRYYSWRNFGNASRDALYGALLTYSLLRLPFDMVEIASGMSRLSYRSIARGSTLDEATFARQFINSKYPAGSFGMSARELAVQGEYAQAYLSSEYAGARGAYRAAINAGATDAEIAAVGWDAAKLAAEGRTRVYIQQAAAIQIQRQLLQNELMLQFSNAQTQDLLEWYILEGKAYAAAAEDIMARSQEMFQSSVLFRGDRRVLGQLPGGNFLSRGMNSDLLEHALGLSDDSYFIPTSMSIQTAQGFAGSDGFVYLIENPGTGIHVNKALGILSPYPHELEIAIPGIIENRYIIGFYPAELNPSGFVPNPNYQGALNRVLMPWLR